MYYDDPPLDVSPNSNLRSMSEPTTRIIRVPAPPTPDEFFRRIAGRPYLIWLDSALPDHPLARHSFVAIDPFLVLRARGNRVERIQASGTKTVSADPLDVLRETLAEFATDRIPGVPFPGGAAGSFGYGLARTIEDLPEPSSVDHGLADLEVGLYDALVWWDHATGECRVVSTGFPESGDARDARSKARANELLHILAGAAGPEPAPPSTALHESVVRRDDGPSFDFPSVPTLTVTEHPGLRSTFSRESYVEAVKQVVEYIRAGDVFQANLSQRIQVPAARSAAAIYETLRTQNPAPFAAYFQGRDYVIASSSPERFLRLAGGTEVETRPIKGTRPRATDRDRDRTLATELLSSEKDRAENLMIVDLLRNDLSRVCEPGHVKVAALFQVESFATVHHLVSIVTGRLEAGLGSVDLLRACFPSGSVTGAPKIRAMEIIAELEPVERGPYCGALGYLGFDGDMDTSVAIRTMVVRGGTVFFHAGGGVVADSGPESEYAETFDKAAGMITALEVPE